MNQKLHILFLCGWYPSRVLPTNGDFIQRHAEAVSLQHKVSVLHIISDENIIQNIEYSSSEINGITTHIAYVKKTKNHVKKIFLFYKAYQKIITKIGNFDLIHLNKLYPFGIFALHQKWFKKKPFIISEHWTDYKHPLSKKISLSEKQLSKLITRNSSFICPVTDDLKQSMQKFGLKGVYNTVPNVVDTSVFYPTKSESKNFTLIHISNMINEHKNVSGILKSFSTIEKRTNNIRLKLIGNNVNKYENNIYKLNISREKCELIQHITHKELAKHLSESDVLVLFSNYENLPCVILEAFSCGIPVISTNVGGISEYFPKGFGKLITVKNEENLTNSIEDFYNKNALIKDKKEMHKYVVENFSKVTICKKFTNLYHKSLPL